MSWDIYYTIRFNVKSNKFVDTLFFGKKKVFDYHLAVEKVFDTYEECLHHINVSNLSFRDIHIRKTISNGGGVMIKDYIYRRS